MPFNYSFMHPYAFLMLLFYLLIISLFKPKKPLLYFSNLRVLQSVDKSVDKASWLLDFLIIFFMVSALSSPVKSDKTTVHYTKGYEIGLLVDASLSMNNNDKFKMTKKILKQFILKRKHDRMSLIVFGDNTRVASPLTYNKQTLLRALKYLKTGIAGDRETSIYQSIFLGVDLFRHVKTNNKIMVLLTDGRNSTGTIPMRIALQKANMHHIKIYTVAIGNKGNFDANILRHIAKATGGRFYEADNEKKLSKIYSNIDALTKDKIKTTTTIGKRYYFEYPLILALVLLAFSLFRREYAF